MAGALLHSAAALPPGQSKGLDTGIVTDPNLLPDPHFWGDVFSIVQAMTPKVIDALSKDFNPSNAIQEAVSNVPAQRRQDKSWVEFVLGAVQALGPPLIQAITGEKDFRQATDVPVLAIPAQIDDKSWFDDAMNVVTQILPMLVREAA